MLGSARVSRAGERVLAIADFSLNPPLPQSQSRERLFRRDAAATDAKQRPGFPTSTRDACAPQNSRELQQLRVQIDLRAGESD
jgi:hypothetical protein